MLPALLEASFARWGDRVAVVDATGSHTYRELAQAVDRLAAHIRATVPGRGARIAVSLERGRAMLVGLLAVWRAGHAYVPVDPGLPDKRRDLILRTARVAAVLSCTPLADAPTIDPRAAAPGGRVPAPGQTRDETAYVIFTSGSTGTPKGVEIPHSALLNFLQSMVTAPGMTHDDRLLAVTTVSFDIAVFELFLPLLVGAAVEIAPRQSVVAVAPLVSRLHSGDITCFQATPTLWAMLLEAGLRPGPGLTCLAGGEPLPADLIARLTAGGARLWNMYGPTEATVWASCGQVRAGAPVTIGDPVANTELLVLDDADRPCPPGTVGELNIGGPCLAKSYFGRPDLTEAAFRVLAIGGRDRRLYRTGDRAVQLADGGLQVLGRRDGQVKLRGFRIELGEVEAALRAHRGVSAAAVDVRDTGRAPPRLVAYVVGRDGVAPPRDALAALLAERLPDYMIPSVWVVLDSLPQTPNGKLDRKALADLAQPSPPVEHLAAIWQDVMGGMAVGPDTELPDLPLDNNSLRRLAVAMQRGGIGLGVRDILGQTTLSGLAQAQTKGQGTAGPARPDIGDYARKPG